MHNNSRGTDYNPVEDVIGDMQLRVADNQSGIEKAENLGLQIIGDGWSTACMIGGVAYGLASSGIDLGINLYQGQDFIDALANAGLHIINNDITQYGVGVVETGSWAFDLEKQRELMREGLNKDAILGEGVGNETLKSMGSWGFTLASMGWGAVATKGVLAATTSLERKALRNGIKATRKELGSEVTEAAINDIKKEIRASWIKKNSIVKSSAIPLMTATPEATLEAGSTYLHALDEGTTKIDETIQRHVDDYVNKKTQEFYDAQQKNPKENKLIIDPSPNMINQWHQEGEALYTAKYQDAYKRIESDAKTATAINFFTNMAILTLSQATVQSTYLPKPVQSALKKSKVFVFSNNITPLYIRDAEGKLIKKFTPAQKVYMALRESGGEAVEEALQTTSHGDGLDEGDDLEVLRVYLIGVEGRLVRELRVERDVPGGGGTVDVHARFERERSGDFILEGEQKFNHLPAVFRGGLSVRLCLKLPEYDMTYHKKHLRNFTRRAPDFSGQIYSFFAL